MFMAQETSESPWLSLLATTAGSDAAAVRELRDSLMAAARDDTERQQVTTAVAAAERVQEELQAGHLQARGLAVLNDLAGRLVSMHDPAGVLQEVAVQSRRLLGSDVAYIMLRRPEGLRIEVLDGTMGSVLRGMALRKGEGVGGEVWRTGKPMWSESYLTDPSLYRVAEIDAAARSEQLGGILGVPLQLAGETIGVLLAADRRPRRFTAREIELLAGLAAHAAVALRNAELIDQLRGVAEELAKTNSELRRRDQQRQRAEDLRDELTSVVLRGQGVTAVALALEAATAGEVSVWSGLGDRLDDSPHRPMVEDAEAMVAMSQGAESTCRSVEHAGRRGLAVAVPMADDPPGVLLALDLDTDDDGFAGLLETAATSVALVLATQRAVALAAARSRGDLMQTLLHPGIDDDTARRRARRASVDLGSVTTVVVLDPGGEPITPTLRLAALAVEGPRGWFAEYEGRVVILLSGPSPAQVYDSLGSGPLPATVGIATCSGGPAHVRRAHQEARQTAAVLLALNRPNGAATADSLGIYRGILSTAGRGELQAFLARTLGPVTAWDAARGRNLLDTLDAYLRQSLHHARTAAELHIHPNTLYQRLERLGRLLGEDWRKPERLAELQLAVTLRALADEIPP